MTRERALSAAKYSIGRIGTLVAEESIQMHGGIGMTWELPLAHYAKRLVMIDHQLGDEDHHLQRYIAARAASCDASERASAHATLRRRAVRAFARFPIRSIDDVRRLEQMPLDAGADGAQHLRDLPQLGAARSATRPR